MNIITLSASVSAPIDKLSNGLLDDKGIRTRFKYCALRQDQQEYYWKKVNGLCEYLYVFFI
jgi:hypothetical protein